MVKRAFSYLAIILFLGLFLTGCTPTFCSTPYILSGGDCCLDKNQDAICDEQQDLSPEEREEYASPLVSASSPKTTSPSLSTTLKTDDEGVVLTIDPDDDPSQGNVNSDVLLIAFGDYSDSGMQRFHKEVLPQIMETYGDKIRYVFRNFPELNNEQAQLAAEASECADEEGKFWDYHNYLFAHNTRLTLSSLRQVAVETGLDLDAFEACFFSHRFKDEVQADKEEGLSYGVAHSPTFFLKNQKIVGYKAYDKFDILFQDIFYKELQAERGTTINAQSTGLSYIILPGPAALEPSITNSPYSNSLELVDAVFSVSATDITARDSATSLDQASLSATYSSKRGNLGSNRDIYTITLTDLLTEGVSHSFFGGVGLEVPIHGNTGVSTRYLPRSTTYLTLWGLGTLSKNGQVLAENSFMHFMVTRGIRDSQNNLLSEEEETDIEAYLLISPPEGTTLPFEGNFLYLYWPDVNLRQ